MTFVTFYLSFGCYFPHRKVLLNTKTMQGGCGKQLWKMIISAYACHSLQDSKSCKFDVIHVTQCRIMLWPQSRRQVDISHVSRENFRLGSWGWVFPTCPGIYVYQSILACQTTWAFSLTPLTIECWLIVLCFLWYICLW